MCVCFAMLPQGVAMADQTPHEPENEDTIYPDYDTWIGGISQVPKGTWVGIAHTIRDVLLGWPPLIVACIISSVLLALIAAWALKPGVELDRSVRIVVLSCEGLIFTTGLACLVAYLLRREGKSHGEKKQWEGERDLPPPEPGP